MIFDILLNNCTVITMDKERRVLRDASIGILNEEISYIGEFNENITGQKTLDCSGKVVMPGLIDTHAHAGHGLIKNIGEYGYRGDVVELYDTLYHKYSTPSFWFAEAMLSGTEKLKFGVTTGVSCLGSQPRIDDFVFSEAHVEGMSGVGIRNVLALGSPSPPYPKTFYYWDEYHKTSERYVSFEESIKNTYDAVKRFNGTNKGITFCYPAPYNLGVKEGHSVEELITLCKGMVNISREFGVNIHSHSYGGDILALNEHTDILNENVFLAHCTGLSNEEIKIMGDNGVSVCSGPYTKAYILERCPVVELMEAGANVTFCTDASAPDRTFDLFEKARMGVHLQRVHFNDSDLITAGKALEMVTINAAKAIGLDKVIGSIELGKKADIIIINMEKPHLYPKWHAPLYILYRTSGQDVDTVIVNGEILMENKFLVKLNEKSILSTAQTEVEKLLRRADFLHLTNVDKEIW